MDMEDAQAQELSFPDTGTSFVHLIFFLTFVIFFFAD